MDQKTCPGCGAAIAVDHPRGLCPACLLEQGLNTGGPTREARCASCQRTLLEDARFCSHCGATAPVPSGTGTDPVRAALETKLQGQYRVVRLLGRGGMGAVYLARDLALDREVAIKVVKTDSDAREVHDRLRREARTAARLSHPNVVPLHSFGELGGLPYFVMGYVRGESLAARLRRDGRLPEDECRRILGEIADALDHAHRQGIVHRDVKPDNVLLDDESGRALLTDFGIAKALGAGDSMTRAGSVLGTPHYMSPEQAGGRVDIDGRSDIYSLGVMAYLMLAGRLPFEGSAPAQILTHHMTQAPPPLRSLAPAASAATVQVVERCLAKDPARRWPDARELKRALGTTEESQLPEPLQALDGSGAPGALIGMGLLLFVKSLGAPERVLAINVAMIAFAYMAVLIRVWREGFSMRQAQATLWREPAWWPFWYPRALRRPGSVWERLPFAVRLLRCMLPTLAAGAALSLYRQSEFFALKAGGFVALALLWGLFALYAELSLRRLGLARADIERVLLSAPLSRASFWTRPHIAAVLAPSERPKAHPRPDSPHDQLVSVLRHAQELSGPLRPLGADAAVAARQLITSIEHADKEIAELARNLEPGEEERLAEKIQALAAAGGADEYAPMRGLLEKQLELIRGLSSRLEQVRERRSRRIEMLKTLALHLASLPARSTEASGDVRSLSERVRVLCDDIGRQSSALTGASATAASGMEELPTLDRTPDETKKGP